MAMPWNTSRSVLRRAGAAMAGMALIAGCAAPATESPAITSSNAIPSSASAQPPDPSAWLTSVMPTDSELSDAVGYPVSVDGPPSVRPGSKLRNTVIGSGDVSERECLGVVSPLEQETYESAPIIAVSFATESAATYGAVAFASAGDAERTFRGFADRWRQCAGRTVVKAVGGHSVSHVISDVRIAENVVSAVDTLHSVEGEPTVAGRALGVAHDCIVEVQIAVDDPSLQGQASERAVRLAEAMLSRVKTA